MLIKTTALIVLQSEQDTLESELIYNYVIPIGVVLILIFISYRLLKILQFYIAILFRKPLFTHVYFSLLQLSPGQRSILKNETPFYSRLSKKHQAYFDHRVVRFIAKTKFVGQQELVVTEHMKIAIAATATMLTFGFRTYLLNIIERVIIYPQAYYSQINKTYHKGEINPQLKAIVFSWEDFKKGNKLGDDNLNLGIHEFGHAIHLNAAKNNDVSSIIFNQGFRDLTNYLKHHEALRQNLIASKYFRVYAYTNHYEFFAVLLENFIETPLEFKSQFPELYKYMKQMLNFKFSDY